MYRMYITFSSAKQVNKVEPTLALKPIDPEYRKQGYRLGPVNSKSFVGNFLLHIKWNSN